MLQSSVKAVPLDVLMSLQKHRCKTDATTAMPPNESDFLRAINMQIDDALDVRKGTAYVEIGATKVICSIDGPKEPTRSGGELEPAEGEIYVYVKNTQTFGATSAGNNGAQYEKTLCNLRVSLETALHTIICLDLFRKAQIDVEVTILDDDGCVLSAALLAASLALCSIGIQVYDMCVTSTVLVTNDGRYIANPSRSQLGDTAYRDAFVVTVGLLPSIEQIACCQACGTCSPEQLKEAIAKATEYSLKLHPLMRKVIEQHVKNAP